MGTRPWSSFFSVLFFVMLLALGIDSAFSMTEALNTACLEALPAAGSPQPATGALAALKRTPPERVPMYLCGLGWLLGIIFCTEAGYCKPHRYRWVSFATFRPGSE